MMQQLQQQQAAALHHLARQNDPMAAAALASMQQQHAALASQGLSGDSGIMPRQQPGLDAAGGSGSLSQFFSAEVLAQASSGNAPSMPPLPTQKALTLEEIELQAAAAVRM